MHYEAKAPIESLKLTWVLTVLYRANLATLMFSSLHSLSQSGEEDEMIDTLEHSFPNAFLGTLLGSADPRYVIFVV